MFFSSKKAKLFVVGLISVFMIANASVALAADTYTIQQGDTLAKIGQKVGMDWKKIADLNNIKDPNVIYAGTALKLKPDYSQQDLNEQSVMAMLWVQTSAEYRELSYQAFNMAKMEVDQALANVKEGDKPLAIITDADETILDNSAYDAGLIGTNSAYSSKTWAQWMDAAKALAIPGATDFLKYADSKGVQIFYVTNRDAKTGLQGTLENFKKLGFPQADAQHLLLKTTTSDKQGRFDSVEKNYNVVVYMGDNANDLPIGTHGKGLADRNSLVDQNKALFGSKYIALPNPVYGDWEPALSKKFYWGLNAKQKDEARMSNLRTWIPSN